MTDVFLLVFSEFFNQQSIVTLSLVLLVQWCCSWRLVTATDLVSLDKTRLTVEEGWTGEVVCSRHGHGENGTLTWIDPSHHVVSVDNRSRIHYDDDSGRLTLRDANLTDSGRYICAFNLDAGCRDDDDGRRRCNVTFHYRVYVMPDYLVDGIVVLVINGVLILVFIACVVQSTISKKRRLGIYGMQKL